MADEQAYVGKLVTLEEAQAHLAYDPFLKVVVTVAMDRWRDTERRSAQLASSSTDNTANGTVPSTASRSTPPAQPNATPQGQRQATSQGRLSGWFRRSGSTG